MANDFSGDDNCKALYRFENGALTTDSKGTNTLTDNNTVTSDEVNFQEGAAAADFERSNNEYFSITDANLDAGFPLKNGDSNKKISICFFWRPETWTTVAKMHFFSKGHDGLADDTSFRVFRDGNSELTIDIGISGGAAWEEWQPGTELTVGKWYHFGITYDDSTKTAYLKVWNVTDAVVVEDYVSNTYANNINVEDSSLMIGADSQGSSASALDGILDEYVIFNDILTEAEIDAIRAGTYSVGAGGLSIPVAMHHYTKNIAAGR